MTLAEGSNKAPVIKLEPVLPPGQLRGTVRNSASGRAIAGATITIEPGGTTATTDADGRFTIDLPPGTYKVTAKADKFSPQSLDVTIEPDPNGVADQEHRATEVSVRTPVALLACVVVAAGCKKKPAPIAELASADGPVERREGEADWLAAEIGTGYFIGDSARTKDGGAKLALAGNATIAMQPHTVMRFGGSGSAGRIAVDEGAIDLTGTGNYQLDIGDVVLSKNGSVRITAKGIGESSLELTIGEGKVTKQGESPLDLVIGKAIDIVDLKITNVRPVDAGVIVDAPPLVDAAVDDAAPDTASEAVVEVTGARAETQAVGDKAWKKLPAGAGTLAKGTKLRLGAGTTVKMTAKSTTLALGPNTRATVGDDLVVAVEAGAVTATVPANETGALAMPGGSFEIRATTGPGETRVDVGGGQTKVAVMRGGGKLVGSTGGALEMNRGESATLTRAGTIHVVEAIPQYFDFRLPIGETLVVHDPKPPTAIEFQFVGKCPQGGIVELDRDARFRTTRISAGKDNANMLVTPGAWAYRLRCTVGDDEGPPIAAGRVSVLRDDGRRPLPPIAATNEIDTDGRTTTISYQSAIPNLVVRFDGTGSQFMLHLASGGKEETFDVELAEDHRARQQAARRHIHVLGRSRRPRSDKVSTLKIDFDKTAPQVYVELPPNGAAVHRRHRRARCSVLAGWTAEVDGTPIPIDKPPASSRRSARRPVARSRSGYRTHSVAFITTCDVRSDIVGRCVPRQSR